MGYAAAMTIPTPADQKWADENDSRLTEQLVVQETKSTRDDLKTLRKRYELRGIKLSEAAAVRLCIRTSLTKLLEES